VLWIAFEDWERKVSGLLAPGDNVFMAVENCHSDTHARWVKAVVVRQQQTRGPGGQTLYAVRLHPQELQQRGTKEHWPSVPAALLSRAYTRRMPDEEYVRIALAAGLLYGALETCFWRKRNTKELAENTAYCYSQSMIRRTDAAQHGICRTPLCNCSLVVCLLFDATIMYDDCVCNNSNSLQ
jgi:hypothetical protein